MSRTLESIGSSASRNLYRVVIVRRPAEWSPRSLGDCPPYVGEVIQLAGPLSWNEARAAAKRCNLAAASQHWAVVEALPSSRSTL